MFIQFEGLVIQRGYWDGIHSVSVEGRLHGALIEIKGRKLSMRSVNMPDLGKQQTFIGQIEGIVVQNGLNVKTLGGHLFEPGQATIRVLIVDTLPADGTWFDIDDLVHRLTQPPLVDETEGRGTLYEQLQKRFGEYGDG